VREAFRRIGRSLSCGGLGAGALPRIGVSRAGWYKASNHSGFIVKALPGHVLKVPPVRIDKITRATTVFDRPITLRPKEFDVLVIMMENKGRAISQRELLSHVWKQKVDPRNSIVRNQIAALRRALGLGSGFIQTASGGLGWGIALEE
jgi:DNA-binding response OmpR family regulator